MGLGDEAERARVLMREDPPVGIEPPKTDGPKNITFFQGLNALPEQMRGTLAAFELMVKALVAEAFTRGFKAGHAAAKAGEAPP